MIDVKKLITGFLILAVAAGVSGLIFSLVSGNFTATAQTPTGPQIGSVGATGDSGVALNSFVDTGTLQGNAAEVLSDTQTTSTVAASEDPDNLTSLFADSFLNGLVVANPDGAATNQSGTAEFNTPDTQTIAAEISSDPALQDFKAPNWNVNSAAQSIKVIPNASPSDVSQYSASLNSIFNKYLVSTEVQNLISGQTPDPSNLPYIATQIQGALSDTMALNVPSSLSGFQTSLVKVLTYEEDSASLGQIATTDPVKASLILENEQAQYSSAITDLQNQMKQTAAVGLLFGPSEPTATVPLIAKLLGVQPAQAIFGLGDISFDPTVFGEMLLTYLNDTILQILKNTLVSLIQQKVLTWIQGSGAPKFVTDWGSQLVNSFQTAAINTLNKQIACVPIAQQQVLKILLSTPAVSNNLQNSCAAEFQSQLGNNLSNYANLYNNFTNFNDYFAVMGPTGNTWSNLITIHDSALAAGATNQTANQSQNIASQGFTGSQVCTDGSNPNGTHEVCADGSVVNIGATSDTCANGAAPTVVPNGGMCENGQSPKTTTPGAVTGQSMATSLQGGVQNITSANNIVGILNSLLSSLLNSLAQDAITSAGTAINGAINGSGGGGLTSIPPSSLNPPTTSSTQTAVQCLPSIQDSLISTSTGQAQASVQAGGGAIDSTCAINNTCPNTENPDGTPIYSWSFTGPASVSSSASTGSSISLVLTTPGSYFATVTGSTDNTTSSCEIDVQ